MKDEKYATMQQAAAYCGIPVRTMYRLARDLQMETVLYGRHLVPASKLDYLKKNRRGRGNPNWVSDPASAADAAILAAKSRARRRRKEASK